MKRQSTLFLVGLAALLISACGSKKQVVDYSYRGNPEKNVVRTPTQPTGKKRDVREVDKLAAAETDRMRAVGIGNDFEEKQARREAMNDARNTLAGYLETAVVALTQEYHKKTTRQTKKVSEMQIEGTVEYAVGQKVSTRMIGTPEIYDMNDGTVSVYVCLELTKTTDDVLGEVYDQLSQDEILGVDYDRQKFIQDNKDRIQELRERTK